ncbi:hypothetical protein GA830_18915 (plasmid) [Mesorhizobium sp. NBSH29]|uniref:hypothetical protein n=1 Tax=Mesorhizobium sp. NBSH29 TaxID=2654249 RepID=UPI001896924F|nr:hypothetical protein [Mesorhizobium sp. NBSH29]QPC88924.1 hypothetical protein GA830_18915 [Mesorhizobium sp. NBSH29]
MRNEAMLSLGKSSNDLSGDNNFTRQNRTAINAETRHGTLADITERHVAAQRAAKPVREAEGEGLQTDGTLLMPFGCDGRDEEEQEPRYHGYETQCRRPGCVHCVARRVRHGHEQSAELAK